MLKNIIIVLLILFLIGSVVWQLTDYANNRTSTQAETALNQEVSTQERVAEARLNVPEVVAVVNDQSITREEFFRMGEQVAREVTSQGFDISSVEAQAEITNRALSNLIDQHLVLTQAQEASVVSSSTWVAEQLGRIVESARGDESLEAQLAQAGLSVEIIRQDLEAQSVTQTFLEEELKLSDITISQSEIEERYAQIQEQSGTSTPELTEIQSSISDQLLIEKQQGVIAEYLSVLREDAEIQINLQ